MLVDMNRFWKCRTCGKDNWLYNTQCVHCNPTPIKIMSIEDCVMYEIRGSWWASFVSWPWAQEISGRYFAWKVKRKHRRYKQSIIIQQSLKAL